MIDPQNSEGWQLRLEDICLYDLYHAEDCDLPKDGVLLVGSIKATKH